MLLVDIALLVRLQHNYIQPIYLYIALLLELRHKDGRGLLLNHRRQNRLTSIIVLTVWKSA